MEGALMGPVYVRCSVRRTRVEQTITGSVIFDTRGENEQPRLMLCPECLRAAIASGPTLTTDPPTGVVAAGNRQLFSG